MEVYKRDKQKKPSELREEVHNAASEQKCY